MYGCNVNKRHVRQLKILAWLLKWCGPGGQRDDLDIGAIAQGILLGATDTTTEFRAPEHAAELPYWGWGLSSATVALRHRKRD
jgi:hypothetical protein